MKPLLVESLSPGEEAQRDENLRGLALTLKREEETDEEAFERVKGSKYIITFKYDEYWPFYHVDHRFGRVIMTINTAHPFFQALRATQKGFGDRRGRRCGRGWGSAGHDYRPGRPDHRPGPASAVSRSDASRAVKQQRRRPKAA
jgi:hypothetical protein